MESTPGAPAPSTPAQPPPGADLTGLAEAERACRACDLWAEATQAVPGEGPPRARVVLVGEQPGDVEDRRGAPFVGPAGGVLDRALREAGIPRDETWVTNAVKHFRWRPAPRGPRRLHQSPAARHVTACRPWLAAELALLRPDVVVALGATAVASLWGPGTTLGTVRGAPQPWPLPSGPLAATPAEAGAVVTATIHPSAVLRGEDEQRAELFAGLVADLRAVAGR